MVDAPYTITQLHRDSAENGGKKDDDGKPPYELLAPEFLQAITEVLAFGKNKYDARNWEKGLTWGRVFGATMRHLWYWWAGKGLDKETGKSHLWHAGCCIMFLITYEMRGIGKDDRPFKQMEKEKTKQKDSS